MEQKKEKGAEVVLKALDEPGIQLGNIETFEFKNPCAEIKLGKHDLTNTIYDMKYHVNKTNPTILEKEVQKTIQQAKTIILKKETENLDDEDDDRFKDIEI